MTSSYGIPGNDDAIRSVRLLADFIADAVHRRHRRPGDRGRDGAAPAEAEAAPAAEAAAEAAAE